MSDDPLLHLVAGFLRPLGLLRSEALILVAVSGGPDSLSLLHLLARLQAIGGPALHVAHLDHGARGAQAEAEAQAVAALAAAWGLPATVARSDVPALARQWRLGLQAAARRARYTFLAESAVAVGARAVAVAHQADDQAETVLLHLLRGAGLAGLRGMRPVVPWEEWSPLVDQETRRPGDQETVSEGIVPLPLSLSPPLPLSPSPSLPLSSPPPLIRPLLAVARQEIAAYGAAHGLAPFDDPSNSAPQFARVRVRRLLALLAAERPGVVEALGRTARISADEYDFMQRALDGVWEGLAVAGEGAVGLRRASWAGLHPALQRHALRRAAGLLGVSELSLAQVEAARALAEQSGRSMALGPALRLEVDQLALTLLRTDLGVWRPLVAIEGKIPGAAPQLAVDELPVAVPGETALGEGWICVVGPERPAEPGPWWVALDAGALDGPLLLRGRRPGDRFRPAGGPGSRKLHDFFVDRKVPRGLRDRWPLLATREALVWVAGLRADARFIAGPTTQSTIWVGMVRRAG